MIDIELVTQSWAYTWYVVPPSSSLRHTSLYISALDRISTRSTASLVSSRYLVYPNSTMTLLMCAPLFPYAAEHGSPACIAALRDSIRCMLGCRLHAAATVLRSPCQPSLVFLACSSRISLVVNVNSLTYWCVDS